jgi:hypothetical protein
LSVPKNDTHKVSTDRRSASFFAATLLVATLILGVGSAAMTPAAEDPASDSTSYVAAAAGSAAPGVGPDVQATKPSSTKPSSTSPASIESATHQETSASISYRGAWSDAQHPRYRGGKATWSTRKGASASVQFTGIGISWIGPTGPTRGKARVYLDGRYVKTVDTYSARFNPSRVLYSSTYATERPRTLTIVVVASSGHPMVAIDALIVRSLERVEGDGPSTVTPVPAPTPTAAPTPTVPAAPSPTPEAGATPTPSSTTAPSGSPTPLPTQTPMPTSSPASDPTQPPAGLIGASIRVTSVAALLDALANDAVSEIVVANGTYRVSPAGSQAANSLWIGSRFADRVHPVTVRAETRGGVTFDGGGAGSFGGLTFVAGAHDQTWEGFVFQNGTPTDTGVIVFGGYQGQAAPHHITLRNVTIRDVSPSGPNGHAVYFSWAAGGPHDLLLDGLTVTSSDYGLKSALHFYHSDSANRNAWNVTVRRLTVMGTQQAIILWDRTVHDVTIDGATITNALSVAVRYEGPGSNIDLRNITSTGSGQMGFYSSLGTSPPGVTFSGNSFQ